MMRIGITDAQGFIGWHLRCRLLGWKDVEAVPLDEAAFNDPDALRGFVASCDAIVHLAGMHRGEDRVIQTTNIRFTRALVEACDAAKTNPHIVFYSSTHRTRDTAYGRSKKACEELWQGWSERTGALLTIFILPHVFGEHEKPYYNSAAATFCDQLCKHESSEVHREGAVELVHVQDVAAQIIAAIQERRRGIHRLKGVEMAVGELYDLLKQMREEYESGIVPRTDLPLRASLFNMLRSFLPAEWFPRFIEKKSDPRGWLFEAIRSRNGGQTFFSTTHPGVTRGNHFHFRKIERFCVVSGSAEIRLRKVLTDETRTYHVDGEMPCWVDMPTLWTHAITNSGSTDLLTMFWSNEIFDPADPDTFAYSV